MTRTARMRGRAGTVAGLLAACLVAGLFAETAAAAVINCAGRTVAGTTPCIYDVDLWFAEFDRTTGLTGPILKNPRDTTQPGNPPRHLWVRSGTSVAVWASVRFDRGINAAPADQARGPLQFGVDFWDHDQEDLLGIFPGIDDMLTSRTVVNVGAQVGSDFLHTQLLGPVVTLLRRRDGPAAKVVTAQPAGFPAEIVAESSTVPQDPEFEDQALAQTLELYAPFTNHEPGQGGVLVTEILPGGGGRTWTRASATFKLSVLLPGEAPPAGALRIPVPLPGPPSLGLVLAAGLAMLWRRPGRRHCG